LAAFVFDVSDMTPKQASYIVTWRESADADRRANLLTVLTWLTRVPELEVIVVEQDAIPRINETLPDAGCKWIFAYNTGPFNKGWGFNIGARHASTRILAFGDADLIVDGVLPQCIAYCAQGYQTVKPYCKIIDLTPEETAVVRSGDYSFQPPRPEALPPNREGQGEFVVFGGGLFFMRTDAFRHVGGWDERFVGWGGEDDAMTYKVERARLSAVELDERCAIHLWHRRAADATSGQPAYATNLALLADYRNYTDAQLRRLADVQLQVGGWREKYRPEQL
jgi:hypothetical protein